MTVLPLALSISSTFTKIGAIAAFAALVGIAILSLLVFSQARELKRLREWAGRAPERAADLEQRVTSTAASRVQQQQAPAAQAVRQVPRAVPIQARAVADGAGPATRVAGTPDVAVVPAGQALSASGAPVTAAPGAPGVPPLPPPAQPGLPSQPGAPALVGKPADVAAPGQSPAPAPGASAPLVPPVSARPPGVPGQPAVPARPAAGTPVASPLAQPPSPVGTPASAAGAAQSRPAPGTTPLPDATDPRPPAPATAAAAAAAAPRAPSPPRPPAVPAAASQPAASPPVGSPPVQAVPQDPSVQPAARRPPAPAPAGAIRRTDTRPPILAEGRRSTYTARRSSRRTALLIAAGLIVLAAVVVAAVTVLGGSSSGKPSSSAAKTAASTIATRSTHAHKTPPQPGAKAPALSPAETTVAVLNATETEDLAHRTASALQQNGYSQAEALNGKPPGSGQVSIVEYANGHQAEAEGVARSADVTHVQPIEAAVAALASSANVVLIVGADKATQSP